MRVRLHPEAEAEYLEAISYYAKRSLRVALEFSREIDALIATLGERPGRWAWWEGSQWRRAKTRKFPYAVLFRVERAEVLILAIAHSARQPEYWRKRRFNP